MRAMIALIVSVTLLASVAVVMAEQAKAPAGHGEAAGIDRAVAVLLPTGDSGVTGAVVFLERRQVSSRVGQDCRPEAGPARLSRPPVR